MPARGTPTTTETWRRSITTFIAGHPDRPVKTRALARELRIPTGDYSTFRGLVRELLDDGTLILGPGRTLRLPEQSGFIVGTFRANRRGFGFIERPGHAGLYVSRGRTGGALEGDTVSARLLRRPPHAPGPLAEVVRIIERAPQCWVGVLQRTGSAWTVRPQGRNPLPIVRIDDPTAHSAQAGDLVVVEAHEHPPGARSVRGAIVECLGDARDARTRILGITRRFSLPDEFPPAVQEAAQAVAAGFNAQRLDGREDLRDLLTITIDPAEARDFDDAISVEPLPTGGMQLGVHIADVAHFIAPSSPLDLEARCRGTSVYFPGWVVPMLPESLSNGVCSLQPGEPRFTKSVFITYDKAARIVATRFADSVIRSAARLTYEQVTEVLERRRSDVTPAVRTLLKDAERLAQRIRRRRLNNGMIVLNLPSVEIQLDKHGGVASAGPADTGFSHTIIEMFMVEANEAVSRELTRAGLQHLRRIHPAPEPERGASLVCLAPVLGRCPPKSLERAGIAALLDSVRGEPAEVVVNYALLRALPQACYSPSAEGHFALASDDYCHFTSPIRRYPDLTVHRLLSLIIRPTAGRRRKRTGDAVLSDAALADLAQQNNASERRAQQAEREADNTLLLMLMKSKVGQVFDGVITSVASFGVFVLVRPYMAEGLVRVADFGPDDWDYDRRAGVFTGQRTRRLVHVGQSLRVQVAAVDELQSELVLVPAVKGPMGVSVEPTRRTARKKGARGPARKSGRR